jgi:murein DD-endopeptidase MepM/ murein hydrolase activator NlpD
MCARRLGLVALVAVVLVGSSTAALAPGAGAQQTDKQRQLTQDIGETSQATAQAREQAAAAQAEKAKLDATVTDLQAQLDASQADLDVAQAQADRLGFASSLLAAQIEDTQHKLDAARDDAKATAVLLYKRPQDDGMLDLIGSADGAGQVVEADRYLERVSHKRRNDLARADHLRKELDAQKAQLDEQQQQADDARDQADAKAEEVDSLLTQQQAARDDAARAQADYEAQVAELTARQAADESDLAAEDARVRDLLASLSDSGPSLGSGQFLRPIAGAPITSGFGSRTDPITGALSSFHPGIDFGAACGTPIKAAGNGSVIFAGFDTGGYGNYVIINHGGGLATLYGHQSAIAVSVGQAVIAGQVIGAVGSTGNSTGCHLHFEVRVNGNPVDPTGYL